MNKLFLSSICAAALVSSASAFTLDLSSLNGVELGIGSITQDGHTFGVSGPGGTPISGGVINLNENQSFTIVFPATVTYGGAMTAANQSVTGSQVQFVANADGQTIQSFTFNPVPEPSSTALLGLGGLALILRRRK